MEAVRTHKKRPEFGNPRHEGKIFPRFIPIPFPKPIDTTLPLYSVLGKTLVGKIKERERIVFHAVGDTGGLCGTEVQEAIAQAMEAQFGGNADDADPAFLYLLGDVIYHNGQSYYYPTQFYEPYKYYPGVIFAIPGNHDGETRSQKNDSFDPEPSLYGFAQNFCTPQRSHNNNAYRDTMTQPYVFWTLRAPFVTIIGLYGNVDGTLDASGEATQRQWLAQQLVQADKSTFIIVAVHQPPYSLDSTHCGYPYIGDAIDHAARTAQVWPDLVLSGHVHNYQRFSRKVIFDSNHSIKTIPYIIAGAGGHANKPKRLHKMRKDENGGKLCKQFQTKDSEVTLEKFNDKEPGFLRIIATQKGKLTVEYYTVPFNATKARKFDSVQIKIGNRKLVAKPLDPKTQSPLA